MKNFMFTTVLALSIFSSLCAENTDLALEQKNDEVLVSLLNNSNSTNVSVKNAGITQLKLYSMDGFGSCPYPLSEKVEGRGCSTQYYVALSIGELGPSQYVFFLGDIGEISDLKAESREPKGVELSFNVHNYASWVYQDFQEEYPEQLKSLKKETISKKIFLGEGGAKEIK